MNAATMTFEELAQLEPGTVVATCNLGMLKGLILRGPGSLCAYIGIPGWHPLVGLRYDDINLDVHGGFTFASPGDDKPWPASGYWFGWDYAHLGDYDFYYIKPELAHIFEDHHSDEQKWTVPEVSAELEKAMYEFMPIFLYGWIEIRFRLFLRWLSHTTVKEAVNNLRLQWIVAKYKIQSLFRK